MRRICPLVFLSSVLVLSCSILFAIPPVEEQKDGNYTLKAGKLSLVIDANYGARVRSLQYDGKEMLTGPDINPTNFGATFWTSPQSEWNWPPVAVHDNKPYQVQSIKNGYIMTSGKDAKQPFQITKQFKANPKKESVVTTYTIKNVSDKEKSVAPWTVTRVAGGGIIFFAADPSSLRPENILPIQNIYNIQWFPYNESPKSRKLFANGEGWLGYLNHGILFILSSEDILPSEVAPKEDELEIYVDARKTYIELENQGKYVSLKPGETLTWSMQWKLRPCQLDPVPSEALKDAALSLLKK
ncbi:MAG: hypothetical protein PHS48_02195 [Bacteroidales bacterium]|nr:hypothetical protein [Bacteroidales bacterium]